MRRWVRLASSLAIISAAVVVTPAVPAQAATSVSAVSVAVSPNRLGATTATYAVDFTTSISGTLGAGTGTVTLTASTSAGTTTFPTQASNYTVDGTVATSVTVPAGTPNIVTITTPVNIGNDNRADIQVAGVTNPTSAAAETGTMSVDTSTDAVPATSTYPLTTNQTTVTGVTNSPTTGSSAGAQTTYSVRFTATTALAAGTDTISLAVPATATAFSATPGDYTVNTVAASAVTIGTSSVTVTIPSGAAVGAGATVSVVASHATNPANPGYYSLDVSTSQDTDPAPSTSYPVAPAPQTDTPSNVTVGINPTTAGAGHAIYTTTFTTSSTGSLAPPTATSAACLPSSSSDANGGGGEITLDAPAGTVFSTNPTDFSVDNTPAGGVSTVSPSSPNDVQVWLACSASPIAADSEVTVVANNTANPAVASTGDVILVSTSADTTAAPSNPYAITPAMSSVTAVSAVVSPNTSGAPGTYTLGFTTSANGTLTAGGGTISVIAPTGTVFPAAPSSYQVDGAAVSSVQVSGASVAVTVPVTIPASSGVTLAVLGVTNPVPGSADTLSVSTSADRVPATSSSYTIAYPSSPQFAVTNANAVVSPTTGGSPTAVYTVGFTNCANASCGLSGPTVSVGGISGPTPGSTITLTAPPGTNWSTNPGDYTVNTVAASAVTVATVGTGQSQAQITLGMGQSISGAAVVSVVAKNSGAAAAGTAVNPATPGYDTLSVATSAALDPAASTGYTITPPASAVADVTTAVSPPTSGAAASYSIGFDTSTQGSVPAGGTISVTAPVGTAFPTTASDYLVNGSPAGSVVVSGTNGATNDLVVSVGNAIPASSAVTLAASTVTNPQVASATTETLSLFTSADTTSVTSGPYTIEPTSSGTTSVTGASASASPGTAGATKVTYTVGFTTSGNGALAANTSANTTVLGCNGGSITVGFPAGTTLSTNTADYTVNTANPCNVAVTPPSGTSSQQVLTLDVSNAVAANTPVTLVAHNATNPTTPGSYQLSVATSADTEPAASSAYAITSPPTVSAVSPSSGPPGGGTDVTVSGQGFSGATAVHFGGAAAQFTLVGPTTITTVSPATTQPGLVDVTVTANGVTSAASAADEFTYTQPAGYVPLATPRRLFDSRSGEGDATQGGSGPLVPGGIVSVTVAGEVGLPASGVGAVALNVTAVGPAGDGNLRAYPDAAGNGQTPAPGIATINYLPGQTVADFDVLAIPSDGKVDLATFGSPTNALLDVVGYFAAGSGYTAAAAPTRITDTRVGYGGPQGPLAANTVYPIAVPTNVVPADATTVAISVSAVTPAGVGNLRVYPDVDGSGTTAPPGASTLNYDPHETTDNFALVQLPGDREIDLYSATSATNVTIDVLGYATSGVVTASPTRIADSRTGLGGLDGELTPGHVYPVTVAGQAGVPATAHAVLVNVTAAQPQGVGNLRVYPDSAGGGQTSPPGTSTINYIPFQDEADFAIVTVPADGKIDAATFGSATGLVLDVVGYLP